MNNSISIYLDRESNIPLYQQIHMNIKQLIIDQKLLGSTKLPSIKTLSKDLGVNLVTVVNAYKLLETDGYVYIKEGSGTFVRNYEIKITAASATNPVIDELYTSEDIELMNSGRIHLREGIINFASTTPPKSLFPVSEFREAIINTIENDGAEAFNYQESLGYYQLRELISSELSKVMLSNEKLPDMNQSNAWLPYKDVRTSADNIQIISGAQQGIDIVAKALLNKDDYVVVENPTYIGASAVFKSRGAKIIDIEISEDGIDIDRLADILRKYRPRIIYTIPTFHNPTGYSYSIEKRKALIRLSNTFGCYIIEDDYLSELCFQQDPLPDLRSLDDYGRVIFIKSYSKLLMPGLRIGYMIVPEKLQANISEAKHTTDISTPGLIQRSFYHYLKKGCWRKHLEKVIPYFEQKYELMYSGLKRLEIYGMEFSKPRGGFNFWLELPRNIDINRLYYQTSKEGVIFIPGRIFFSRQQYNCNFIRLSFAQVSDDEIVNGINILERILCNDLNESRQKKIYPLV